jgi:cytochrome oxidase Cu insertion factor (SCO1/SenC/PrrC family)
VLYLMDRKGAFRDVIAYSEDHDRYVDKIKKLLTE